MCLLSCLYRTEIYSFSVFDVFQIQHPRMILFRLYNPPLALVLSQEKICEHIACVRQREQAEVGWALRAPDRIFFPNLTSKACWLSLWPQASEESERHPGQMPRLLLERGIRLTWESVAGVGKWRPKMVSSGSVGQAWVRSSRVFIKGITSSRGQMVI